MNKFEIHLDDLLCDGQVTIQKAEHNAFLDFMLDYPDVLDNVRMVQDDVKTHLYMA